MKTFSRSGLCAVLVSVAGLLYAEDIVYMDPFTVYSPSVMAQGGSASAAASGYESLFTNPAGFAGTKNRLTLASVSAWGFGDAMSAAVASGYTSVETAAGYGYNWDLGYTLETRPETLALTDPNYAPVGASDYNDKQGTIQSQVAMRLLKEQLKSGVGAGFSLGAGYVGGGLGLGFVASSNLFLQGDTFPFGIAGPLSTTVAFIGGIALPLNLGPLHLTIGGDLRPMVRFYSELDGSAANSLTALMKTDNTTNSDQRLRDVLKELNGNSIYQGTGIGIDLGAKLELGSLTVGFTVRDLFDTRFASMNHKLGDFMYELITSQSVPSNKGGYETLNDDPNDIAVVTESDIVLALPMTMSLGVAYRPDMGSLSFLIDPMVHADLVDPIGVFRDKQSPWALLHLGTEVKILQFLKLRAGINQGYATLGFGAHFFVLDINGAWFTRELGPYAGDRPNAGFTLEAALRI